MKTRRFRRLLLSVSKSESALRSLYRLLPLSVLVSVTIFLPGQNTAPPLHPTQDNVEATYLYNLGKFVHWPTDEQHRPLNICVLGQDPFGQTLDLLVSNKLIEDRPLAIIRLPDTTGIQSCSILFVSSSEAPQVEEDLSVLATSPIMTVSDMPDFLNHGGMIQFVLKKEDVRFEVNLNATNKCGLVLSSQLLKLAVSVIGTPAGKVAR